MENLINDYIKKLNEHSKKDFEKNYSNILQLTPVFSIQTGKRWVKVVSFNSVQKSVFCFIDPQTGDIYKPAGWNAPAKGIRGNIKDEKPPLTDGELYRYR